MFKRMMVLGAVASALLFTGCQERSRQERSRQDTGATGGAGTVDDQSGVGGSGTKSGKPTGTMGGSDAGTGGSDAGTR